MVESSQPKTAASVKSLQTAREAWPFQKEDYAIGHQLKAEGKPIAWSCALAEMELYYALGVWPFFPEQFAALFSVKRKTPESEKEAVRFARIAEAAGFRDYLCGYSRVALGYTIHSLNIGDFTDAPLMGPPKPDMLVTTSSACDVRLKWFEDMAKRMNVPMFTLDRPERTPDCITGIPGFRSLLYGFKSHIRRDREEFLVGTPADHEVDYYVSQLEDFISFLEQVTGNKFDVDKLNEVLDLSYRNNEVRQEILQLRKAVPAPMPVTDGFACMYPGMYRRGTQRCLDFYVKQRDELRERVARGEGALPNERFRLLFYGLPFWFNMSVFNYFEKWGGVFAYEPSYNPLPWPPLRPDDPLRWMAIRTLMGGTGVGSGLSGLVHDCIEYKISGVVMSYLITCRPVVFPTSEIAHVLEEELGIPTEAIEGDLVDERLWSEAQVATRLDAFAEQVLKKVGIEKD